jgi:hypothetical protein
MLRLRYGVFALAALCSLAISVWAGEANRQDFNDLQKVVEELRTKLAAKNATPQPTGAIGRADTLIDNKYGPNAKVTTKDGKLTIGGLLQVWAYVIENDNANYVADRQHTNELNDNDGYRIRRSELKFSLDLTDDITAVVTIDPTGGDEGNTFPGLPSNQGLVGQGIYADGSELTLEDLNPGHGSTNESERDVPPAQQRMTNGVVRANRVLQDAYINYHPTWIPHHDFTVGQFKAPAGEETYRNSGQLDFVERAMINQFGNQRDLGIMVHGWWWGDRFQYWIGGFNTAGSFHNTFASLQNRSDDNDAKDLAWRLQLRPLWNHEKFGSLEVGFARQDGVHGESGHGYTYDNGIVPTVDGLSLQETHANRQYAWAWYRPAGPVKGWWLRGEWASMTDRPLPGLGATTGRIQLRPRPFDRDGWYFGTGYRLSKSIWSDRLQNSGNFLVKMLNDAEFTYRYETFGNLLLEDVVYQTEAGYGTSAVRTDIFKSSVHTVGLNYYWKGYNVRTQVNYMFVNESDGHYVSSLDSNGPRGRRVRDVRNNVFVISQQIQW